MLRVGNGLKVAKMGGVTVEVDMVGLSKSRIDITYNKQTSVD